MQQGQYHFTYTISRKITLQAFEKSSKEERFNIVLLTFSDDQLYRLGHFPCVVALSILVSQFFVLQ